MTFKKPIPRVPVFESSFEPLVRITLKDELANEKEYNKYMDNRFKRIFIDPKSTYDESESSSDENAEDENMQSRPRSLIQW